MYERSTTVPQTPKAALFAAFGATNGSVPPRKYSGPILPIIEEEVQPDPMD
jgi:hypothetical protein